ncbi:Amuc_1098 family type IV pilus outer membrane protein [Oceaniferula spumae]
MCTPQILTPAIAQESVVQKELNRRAANARQAYELLKTGDAAYEKQDYKTAVKDYAQAFELLPNGFKTEEIRVVAGVRYATAATERARKLAKGGDYDAARQLLDRVLQPEIAPTHMGALKLRQQIEDPIRYNHALTPEHVRDAEKVGRHLREAEGFYSLGQYDRALTIYNSVLRIDPYNHAARRGMEKINTVKMDYARAAKDHNRAHMLSEVDKQWEIFVPPTDAAPVPVPLTRPEDLAPDIRDRLAGITIEVIDLDNVTLNEALDFIRLQSRLGDTPGPNGEKTGVNIILNVGPPSTDTAKKIAATRISLKARNLPLSKVLDYVTDQSHTQWRTDGVGVLVTPLGSIDGALSSRTFRVPPNFLTSASTNQKEDDGNVFDSDSNDRGEGLLPEKMSITDFLKQNGVSFPDGASATYTPSTNTLIVRNTLDNIDLVDQLVSLVADEEPVQVAIKTTIIRVSEKKLKELGFDWAITPWAFGKGGVLGGGTTGNGTPLGVIPQPPFTAVNGNPITSGNRSGSGAIQQDSIDTFLNATSTGSPSSTATRAPGILTLSYVGSGVQVQMMMRGLNQNTGADIMVNPSTISRSGERSKIEIIREFIYPTEYEPPELPNSVGGDVFIDPTTGEQASASPPTPVTPSHPTAFETRNVGVTLEVEPTVGPDKQYIELSLRPELVEFEGFVNYGSPINGVSAGGLGIDLGNLGTGNVFTTTGGSFGRVTDNRILMPVFKVIRLPNSSLTIQDGHTVVIGGLMTSRKTKVEDKTPILGDVPYLGRLFRSEADQTFTEAIIIMVNAELVDPTGKPWRQR